MKTAPRTAALLGFVLLTASVLCVASAFALGDADPLEHAVQVKERHQYTLLALPGVVGVGVGRAADTGEVVIQIYASGQADDDARLAFPSDLEGVRVVIVESGEVRPRSE